MTWLSNDEIHNPDRCDFCGHNPPDSRVDIGELKESRDYWREQAEQVREGVKRLIADKNELFAVSEKYERIRALVEKYENNAIGDAADTSQLIIEIKWELE